MPEIVADLGEFGLIQRLQLLVEQVGEPLGCGDLGIGDDAAVLTVGSGQQLVVTCDAMVEGRHYLAQTDPRDVGWRAAMVNLSDVGAMGGQPRFATLSLGLRPEQGVEAVESMYRGFLQALAPFGVAVVGGNITMTDGPAFLDVTLVGEVAQGRAVRRSGARPGDAVLVTGFPGQAAAGLRLLQEEGFTPAVVGDPLVRAYLRPQARVPEGQRAARCGVHAMIDTSDGFVGDLGHIVDESGVGVQVQAESLPVSAGLRRAAGRWHEDPLALFLAPSDDYELILTCAPDQAGQVAQALAALRGVPVAPIGTVTDQPGRMALLRDGREAPLQGRGWDHFRS